MKIGRSLPIVCTVSLSASNPQGTPLQGTWTVSAVDQADCTCLGSTPGDLHTYVWEIDQLGDGTVHIVVQGKTSFPRLVGHWNAETRQLVVNGYETEGRGACWLKLTLQADGKLRGIRRYISGDESLDHRPCFVDYQISAVKEPNARR